MSFSLIFLTKFMLNILKSVVITYRNYVCIDTVLKKGCHVERRSTRKCLGTTVNEVGVCTAVDLFLMHVRVDIKFLLFYNDYSTNYITARVIG